MSGKVFRSAQRRRNLIETRHGKEVVELSMEFNDGLMHRRVRWPDEGRRIFCALDDR